jgi:hypothetical protein
MASLNPPVSTVDEVTVDLRNSTITPAESSHAVADLRRPVVNANTPTPSNSSPVTTSSPAKTEGNHEHECPGHYILNGMVSLVSDDVSKLVSQQKEIKEVLDTIMPAIADKLNKLGIGLRLQFGDKIGMVKCPPSTSTDVDKDKQQ